MKAMSRKAKKRNKPYTGADAAPTKPVVHHYVAIQRSPLGEWWQAKKGMIKTISAIAGVALIVVWLIYELLMMIF